MMFQRAALYLRIPESYCRSIGGLRWAHYGDAVEFVEGAAGGQTFAFAPEIALFMEGFREMEGGFPAFGHVLHLLYLIGLADRSGTPGGRAGEGCLERVAHLFRQEGCPLRNAGALCAALVARTHLGAADPPELSEIHDFLTEGHWVPSIVLAQAIAGACAAG